MSTNLSTNLTETDSKILRDDAAAARKEGRLEVSTAPVWDGIVARHGNGKGTDNQPKRADILRAVLTECGEWKGSPQKDKEGKRTPFGNVVQRFGARFDAAVKRATPDTATEVTLRVSLSGEGGGSTVVPADHPMYADIVALLNS